MEIDTLSNDLRKDDMQGNFQLEMVECPNCKEEVPKSIYCLKCGFPLYNLKEETRDVTIEVSPDPFDLQSSDDKMLNSEHTIVSEEEITPEITLYDEEQTIKEEDLSISELLIEESEDLELEIEEDEEDISFLGEAIEDAIEEAYQDNKFEEEKETDIGEVSYERKMEIIECDSQSESEIKQLTKELLNVISLKLWSIDLLLEGRVEESHFNRIFEGYLSRSDECMKQRDEMLKRIDDVKGIKKALEEVKVGLGELEIRKSIGDLREGEYEAKAPAYQWDILHYEEALSKKREEVDLLMDLTKVVSMEVINDMKERTRNADAAIDNIEKSGKIGSETIARIRSAMEETMNFLDDHRNDAT